MELNDVLRKVRALTERAQHPETPAAEAESAQKMADTLMYKYRIDQAMLEQSLPEAKRSKPGRLSGITIAVRGNPARGWLIYIVERIAQHCRVSVVYHGLDYTRIDLKGTAVGYESDLAYFEILWTQVYLHLGSTITPKWNEHQSEEQNVIELHKRGLNWLDIARLDSVQPGGRWDGSQDTAQKVGSRIKRIYSQWCKRTGNPYVASGNRIQYIKNFAEHFYYEMNRRLTRIEKGRDSSGALVLASDAERIQEAINEMFGELKSGGRIGGLSSKFNPDAAQAGTQSAREVDLSADAKMGGRDAKALPS